MRPPRITRNAHAYCARTRLFVPPAGVRWPTATHRNPGPRTRRAATASCSAPRSGAVHAQRRRRAASYDRTMSIDDDALGEVLDYLGIDLTVTDALVATLHPLVAGAIAGTSTAELQRAANEAVEEIWDDELAAELRAELTQLQREEVHNEEFDDAVAAALSELDRPRASDRPRARVRLACRRQPHRACGAEPAAHRRAGGRARGYAAHAPPRPGTRTRARRNPCRRARPRRRWWRS